MGDDQPRRRPASDEQIERVKKELARRSQINKLHSPYYQADVDKKLDSALESASRPYTHGKYETYPQAEEQIVEDWPDSIRQPRSSLSCGVIILLVIMLIVAMLAGAALTYIYITQNYVLFPLHGSGSGISPTGFSGGPFNTVPPP